MIHYSEWFCFRICIASLDCVQFIASIAIDLACLIGIVSSRLLSIDFREMVLPWNSLSSCNWSCLMGFQSCFVSVCLP